MAAKTDTEEKVDDLRRVLRKRLILESHLPQATDSSQYVNEERTKAVKKFWGGEASSDLAQKIEALIDCLSRLREVAGSLGLLAEEVYALQSESSKHKERPARKQSEIKRSLSSEIDSLWNRVRWIEPAIRHLQREQAEMAQEAIEAAELKYEKALARILGERGLGDIDSQSLFTVRVFADKCTGFEFDQLVGAVENVASYVGFGEVVFSSEQRSET